MPLFTRSFEKEKLVSRSLPKSNEGTSKEDKPERLLALDGRLCNFEATVGCDWKVSGLDSKSEVECEVE